MKSIVIAVALLAACGGERGPIVDYLSDIQAPQVDGSAVASLMTAEKASALLESNAALKSTVAPPVLNTVFLDFADGTYHSQNPGSDPCANKAPPNPNGVCTDDFCRDYVVTQVGNFFSNPLYPHPGGKLNFNVTRVRPDNTSYHTIVLATSGTFCGYDNTKVAGTTNGVTACSGSGTQVYQVGYVFNLVDTNNFNLPRVAAEVVHEIGHQYGLAHSVQYPKDDLMGVAGPRDNRPNHPYPTYDGNYVFSWGAVPVVQDGANPCGYATQDDFGQLYSWVELGHGMR
jgi:hypothetical protein